MSQIDRLNRLRYNIDMHLLIEKDKDKLKPQAGRLFELAKDYKEAGHLKDAICEIKRALQIIQNKEYQTFLAKCQKQFCNPKKECPYGCGYEFSKDISDLCPRCKRLIRACSKCMFPNRLFDPFCRWCGIEVTTYYKKPDRIWNFVSDWFYHYPFDFLLPSPVIVGDLLILPLIKEGSIMALKIANGELAWRIENIFPSGESVGLLFVYPYLYVYNTKIIERIVLGLSDKTTEIIYTDVDTNNIYPSFPLVHEKSHKIFFPVNSGLFVHDTWRPIKRGRIYKTEIKEKDEIFYPVMLEEKILVFSSRGRIYNLRQDKEKMNIYFIIDNYEHIGPPIANEKWIFFEAYSRGKRILNAYSENIISLVLPDLFCSVDDINFCHPPLLYEDGVLLVSCESAKLYFVRSVGNRLNLKEINIDVSVGTKRVLNIDLFLSSLNIPYFISRVPDGFFYINLEDITNKGMEFFGGEMVSKPLVFNNRLILLCKDGIRCYTF